MLNLSVLTGILSGRPRLELTNNSHSRESKLYRLFTRINLCLRMGSIMKYIINFFIVLIPFTVFWLEHKWKDKRTRKYKLLRRVLIGLFILLGILNIYSTYLDSEKAINLEAQIALLVEKNSELSDNFRPFILKWADLDKDDPRITDGAIILFELKMKESVNYEGTIFDMRNEKNRNKNRVNLSISDGNLLKLDLYDHEGKKHSTEGHITIDSSKPCKFECLWSFKYNFIAIRFNDKIIANSQIPKSKLDLRSTDNYTIYGPSLNAPLWIRKIDVYAEKSKRVKIFDSRDIKKDTN